VLPYVLDRELGPAMGIPHDAYTEKKKVQMSRETGRDPTVRCSMDHDANSLLASVSLCQALVSYCHMGALVYEI
jgi:hypothetical protein